MTATTQIGAVPARGKRQIAPLDALLEHMLSDDFAALGDPRPTLIFPYTISDGKDAYTLTGRLAKTQDDRCAVYRGIDLGTGAKVAIKASVVEGVDVPGHARVYIDHATRHAIREEARLIDRLQHPGVVRTRCPIDYEGRLFLPMEHLPFAIEREFLNGYHAGDRKLAHPQALGEFMDQMLDVLAHLEERGIVHHDIKPANLRARADSYGRPTQAVLIDFGIARELGGLDVVTDSEARGTQGYIAPECFLGVNATDNDVYSLGRTVLHAVEWALLPELEFMGHASEPHDLAKELHALGREPEESDALRYLCMIDANNKHRLDKLRRLDDFKRYPQVLPAILEGCLRVYESRLGLQELEDMVWEYKRGAHR